MRMEPPRRRDHFLHDGEAHALAVSGNGCGRAGRCCRDAPARCPGPSSVTSDFQRRRMIRASQYDASGVTVVMLDGVVDEVAQHEVERGGEGLQARPGPAHLDLRSGARQRADDVGDQGVRCRPARSPARAARRSSSAAAPRASTTSGRFARRNSSSLALAGCAHRRDQRAAPSLFRHVATARASAHSGRGRRWRRTARAWRWRCAARRWRATALAIWRRRRPRP